MYPLKLNVLLLTAISLHCIGCSRSPDVPEDSLIIAVRSPKVFAAWLCAGHEYAGGTWRPEGIGDTVDTLNVDRLEAVFGRHENKELVRRLLRRGLGRFRHVPTRIICAKALSRIGTEEDAARIVYYLRPYVRGVSGASARALVSIRGPSAYADILKAVDDELEELNSNIVRGYFEYKPLKGIEAAFFDGWPLDYERRSISDWFPWDLVMILIKGDQEDDVRKLISRADLNALWQHEMDGPPQGDARTLGLGITKPGDTYRDAVRSMIKKAKRHE